MNAVCPLLGSHHGDSLIKRHVSLPEVRSCGRLGTVVVVQDNAGLNRRSLTGGLASRILVDDGYLESASCEVAGTMLWLAYSQIGMLIYACAY